MNTLFVNRISLFLAFLLLVCSPITSKGALSDQDLEGFDDFIIEAMKDWNAPGVAVCIVKDGKVVLSKGYGFRDLKNNLEVTPKTIFSIGSSTKAFTAAGIGILVDQGKVNWDEPVRKYMPSFNLSDSYVSERITLRDILCQRSGIPRHELMWFNTYASRKELFNRLQHLELNRDFRTAFQYCNLMKGKQKAIKLPD